MDWVFYKTRNDHTLTLQKGDIKIWVNLALDWVTVTLSETSKGSDRRVFSYGKFALVKDLESSKKFIETMIQEMPDGCLEECGIYVTNKLKDYGDDNGTL